MVNLTTGYGTLGFAGSDKDNFVAAACLLAGSYPLETSLGTLLDPVGALPAFSLIGRITASGKLTLSLPGAADGSQVPIGITIAEYADVGADIANATFYRSGNFNFDAINKDGGWTLAALRIAVSGTPLFFGVPKTATPVVPA